MQPNVRYGCKLNPLQEAREADFRYGLVRVRENAESIAFYGGEASEQQLLLKVRGCSADLMIRGKLLCRPCYRLPRRPPQLCMQCVYAYIRIVFVR